MRRRLQVLAVCATVLLALRMMAQDTGAGSGAGATGDTGGTTTPDTSGAAGTTGGAADQGATGNGGATEGGNGAGSQNGTGGMGAGEQNGTGGAGTGEQNGTGTGGEENGTGAGTGAGASPSPTPGSTLFGPGTTGTEGGGFTLPNLLPGGPAGGLSLPGITPPPSSSPSPTPSGAGSGGGQSQAPVTFSLPGGYGGAAPQTFTLGQGRLAKPPITFTFSVSQGYDDNIYSAPSHVITAAPVPTPTPPLEARILNFRISPPSPPTPVLQFFRPAVAATPTPAQALGVVGSAVSSASVGIQVQKGTARSVVTMDLSIGEQDYWNEPGSGANYTGGFDLSLFERLTPRANLSVEANAVYQNSPNYSLLNAPTTTNNNASDYLNGNAKFDLTYAWTSRISTVTSYAIATNLPGGNSTTDLYESTYGTQFRYTVSARNTLTAEIRQTVGDYPSDSVLNTTSTFFLLGIDSFVSSRIRVTLSGGLDYDSLSAPQHTKLLPYFESAATLGLPRGAAISWTNRYGEEESSQVDQSVLSYRTALTYSEPLSAKLSAAASLVYNNVNYSDPEVSAGSSRQNQFQMSLSLGYTVSPRLSFSLSYNYFDLTTTVINSSYQRQQVYFGATYLFQ